MNGPQPLAEADRGTRHTPGPEEPLVSVVVPVRNEAGFIGQLVRSFLDGTYPRDRLEVLVVDGMSEDGTREIVNRLSDEDSRVQLLDNPSRVTPAAMNLGVQGSAGDVVIIIGGHATVAPDYVAECVRALNEHPEAWVSGGVMETVGTSYLGSVVAAAMSNAIGVGAGNFRLGTRTGYVSSVPFGAHRRWVFEKVGLFNEELVRNQDDEHVQRMNRAGAKHWMSPSIRSRYYPRSSLIKLARQYFQYGFWRIRTFQLHGRPANVRQVAPLVFVMAWFLLAAGSAAYPMGRWLLLGAACAYIAALAVGAVLAGIKAGAKVALLVPVAIAIMHFSYGAGCLKGLWSWGLLGGRRVRRGGAHPLSR